MKGFKSKSLVQFTLFSLFVGMILVSPVLADEEGQPIDPNVVRGFITSVGRDHIQMNATRYTLFPNTRYINEEGGLLNNGKKTMKTNMKIDLLMEKGVVIQVTIYGLLRR